ncbi:MAG TPA: CoA-binding protein [Herpetosiphonaceae bacterium]
MEDQQIRRILQDTRVIAVVGLSDNPARPSYGVTRYMQSQGYRIVPINPELSEVFGERAYPDLLSVPFDVDLVDIFRRSEAVGPHVDEAIRKGVRTVWMQLGVYNEAAAQQARAAGIDVIMNRCILIEHRRLLGG